MIRMVKSSVLVWFTNDICLVPPIGPADEVEEFSDVEDQTNDNDLR